MGRKEGQAVCGGRVRERRKEERSGGVERKKALSVMQIESRRLGRARGHTAPQTILALRRSLSSGLRVEGALLGLRINRNTAFSQG